MDEYHRIEVKNVSIINVCFRKIGALFNSGRIVLDVDTYDFAGHLSDDVIVGFYRDGKYFVHYYSPPFNKSSASGPIFPLPSLYRMSISPSARLKASLSNSV